MLSFWTRFRTSLLLSSPSSPGIIYYSVLLWIMDNGLNRLLYYRGMYWLVLGGKKGLYKVADHFPCTQSGPGDRRKNICVISPADHRHVFADSILHSGCRHHISLWDRIWGGTQVLTYWVMSYRLHKYPFKTFSALNNDLCLSIIQDSFCS